MSDTKQACLNFTPSFLTKEQRGGGGASHQFFRSLDRSESAAKQPLLTPVFFVFLGYLFISFFVFFSRHVPLGSLPHLSLFSPAAADNFPQMAHQKRFIERKYRQELKEMRRERERQEKDGDETNVGRK